MFISWQDFLRRNDVSKLTLAEQKKKFLYENQLAADRMRYFETIYSAAGGAAGGAGGSGQVIDGPIKDCTVQALDENDNVIAQTTTNTLGKYTFPAPVPEGSTIKAFGGTDSITNLAYTGTLFGNSSFTKTISPISTFTELLRKERSITFEDALTNVIASSSAFFGQELSEDKKDTYLNEDYIEKALKGDDAALAAYSVGTFIEGSTEMICGYEQGGSVTTEKKDAAYLSMVKQMATFTSSVNLEECLADIATDNAADALVIAKRAKMSTLLSSYTTDVFAVTDEQDKDDNYLVTKLSGLNRSGKKIAEVEVANIKSASDEGAVRSIEVSVTEKYNTESRELAQIEEGVENKRTAVAKNEFTKRYLRIMTEGPVFRSDSYNVRGTFHTGGGAEEEIVEGTVFYLNGDPTADANVDATEVVRWNDAIILLQNGFSRGGDILHYHNNQTVILGDTNTTAGDGSVYSQKYYEMKPTQSGSGAWEVANIYEGNPIEASADDARAAAQYIPVTQSYPFPPMDITLKTNSNTTGFKIITTLADDEAGQEEVSFAMNNIKFTFNVEDGQHTIESSSGFANTRKVIIRSNTHSSICLKYENSKYYIMYKNVILGEEEEQTIEYRSLFVSTGLLFDHYSALWRMNATQTAKESNAWKFDGVADEVQQFTNGCALGAHGTQGGEGEEGEGEGEGEAFNVTNSGLLMSGDLATLKAPFK